VQHLVYLGALFNVERDAAARVDQIAQAYNDLVTTPGSNAPTVLWVSRVDNVSLSELQGPNGKPLQGLGYTVSFAPYKTALTKDAGAAVVPAAQVQRAETGGAVAASSAANAGEDVNFVQSTFDNKAAMLRQLHSVLQNVDILIDESFVLGAITEVRTQHMRIVTNSGACAAAYIAVHGS
jgi:hypothetical protein